MHGKNISYVGSMRFADNIANNLANNANMLYAGQSVRCYVSLTTIPSRLSNDSIFDTLQRLVDQTVQPTGIYLSICDTYQRNNAKAEHIESRIAQIAKRFPTIQYIRTKDYGPATKLLGLLGYNRTHNFLNPTDLIIVCDDDMIYSRDMVRSHLSAYHTYYCDMVAVDQKHVVGWHPYQFRPTDTIYHDQYNGSVYGWLSFAITYRATAKLLDFYNRIVKLFPASLYHDDMIFSLYGWVEQLYCVENRHITIDTTVSRTSNDGVDALRDQPRVNGIAVNRGELETRAYRHFHIKAIQSYYPDRPVVYQMYHDIPARPFYLVDTAHHDAKEGRIHCSIQYIDTHHILVTITVFDTALQNTSHVIWFAIHGTQYSAQINISKCMKFSHIFGLKNQIRAKPHTNPSHHCMQTHASDTMVANRFYSIATILVCSPEYPYKFYDNARLNRFVSERCTDVVRRCIANLVPGAYVSDVFRYLYTLAMGYVVYIDCKKIMYIPMSDFIGDPTKETYVSDCVKNYAYNSIFVTVPNSQVMRLCAQKSLDNIIGMEYGADPLCCTGPGVHGMAIDRVYGKYEYLYRNSEVSCDSCILDRAGMVCFKNTYHGYYQENNYITTSHYSVLWKNRKIYRNRLSHIQRSDNLILFNQKKK
jgi:hypothetical protein